MKSFLLFSLLGWMALTASSASAALSDIEIKAVRQKLDEAHNSKGYKQIDSKDIRYTITVQSTTFKQLSDLEVKYMIFYYDSKPGDPDKPVEQSKTGTEKIIAIAGNKSVDVETTPITLTTVTLAGNWYYGSGASNQSKDRVSGLWIRVYSQGVMIGEYANPSTIKKRDWKD